MGGASVGDHVPGSGFMSHEKTELAADHLQRDKQAIHAVHVPHQ